MNSSHCDLFKNNTEIFTYLLTLQQNITMQTTYFSHVGKLVSIIYVRNKTKNFGGYLNCITNHRKRPLHKTS